MSQEIESIFEEPGPDLGTGGAVETSLLAPSLGKPSFAHLKAAVSRSLVADGGKPAKSPVDFNPDDLVIVQKRQDWRVKVAVVCLDCFESREVEELVTSRKSATDVRVLRERYGRIADQIRRDVPALLVTAVTVHELEAVRFSINYFLEEIVRHVRTHLQQRHQSKSPLEGSSPEEIAELVRDSLAGGSEALFVFIDDLVKLTQFEIEVSNQRERIRLLLGGDRSLSTLGNNEAIMTAPIAELWREIDEFTSVAAYLEEHLPPVLNKASPYPALDEELRLAKDQFQAVVESRVEPFEQRATFKREQDRVLRRLEGDLDTARRSVTNLLEFRVEPLRQVAAQPGMITTAVLESLHGAASELAEALARLPSAVVLPLPETPLDGRGENREKEREAVAILDERLENVGLELARFRRVGHLDREEGVEAAVLAGAVGEVGERLRTLRQLLDDAHDALLHVRERKVHPLRAYFCTIMGEFRTFLQTSFAHIAATDPRSTESSYHFFLREFSNEAHQALLLLKEIRELEAYINNLQSFSIKGMQLTPENLARILRVLFIDKEEERKRIPSGEGWKLMSTFLGKLKDDFVPRLQRICALDGIRYEDKNNLQEWAMDLTRNCTLCLAQHEIGYGLSQEMGRLREEQDDYAARQSHLHIVTARTCKAMEQSLKAVCMTLTETIPYVGIMRGGIEHRASVFFHRQQQLLEEGDGRKIEMSK